MRKRSLNKGARLIPRLADITVQREGCPPARRAAEVQGRLWGDEVRCLLGVPELGASQGPAAGRSCADLALSVSNSSDPSAEQLLELSFGPTIGAVGGFLQAFAVGYADQSAAILNELGLLKGQ